MLLLYVTVNRAEESLPLQLCHAILSNAVRCKYSCPFSIRVHVLFSVLLTSSFCLLCHFSFKSLLLICQDLLQTSFSVTRCFHFKSLLLICSELLQTSISVARCFCFKSLLLTRPELLQTKFSVIGRFSFKSLLLTRPELLRRFRFQSGTASRKTRFSLFTCFRSYTVPSPSFFSS